VRKGEQEKEKERKEGRKERKGIRCKSKEGIED
jgi:hypothetical protein